MKGSGKWMVVGVILLAGCGGGEWTEGAEDRERYIDFCRETAMLPVRESDGDDVLSGVDWMVYPCSFTSHEFKKEYRMVYADERYLSFRCEEFAYMGGAHGSTKITVGTFERGSGRRLELKDVLVERDEAELKRELRAKAIEQLGGEEELQGELGLTENFYLAADGWHFVYNEYEIACYAQGPVEITVGRAK